jgi:hypothetical protein
MESSVSLTMGASTGGEASGYSVGIEKEKEMHLWTDHVHHSACLLQQARVFAIKSVRS